MLVIGIKPMTNSALWSYIGKSISSAIGKTITISNVCPVSGGDTHQSYKIEDKNRQLIFFVKCHQLEHQDLLVTEALNLATIEKTQSIRTPKVITQGNYQYTTFLVLEYLPINAQGNHYSLGEKLAALHKNTAENYGFYTRNFIGTTSIHLG